MFYFLLSHFRLEIIKVCPNTPYASSELFLVGDRVPLPFLPVTSVQVCEYFKFYLSKPLSFDTLPRDPSALTCLLHFLPFLGPETAVFHTKCVCPQCHLLSGQLTILASLSQAITDPSGVPGLQCPCIPPSHESVLELFLFLWPSLCGEKHQLAKVCITHSPEVSPDYVLHPEQASFRHAPWLMPPSSLLSFF